ncbi:DUF3298 domain-containing protein [uncultured Desulfovibrio sp.]|uniref:DUF3298 and DUF4163 domain-containing protein n=1 Tax=uncultured Desulfovibrio sp. TaxID=167968 RepID=UPI002803EC17|nr:DUF3298 domain-containing protein [uncultured Desulfovibrio sp.]
MQRTAFSTSTVFAILVAAACIFLVPRVDAAPPETQTRAADAPRTENADQGRAADPAPETTDTPNEAAVSRIESITPESPAVAPEPENAAPEQAVYPDVRNVHLQSGGNGSPAVSLYYPEFGMAAVDADLRAWAEGVARSYEEDVRGGMGPDDEKPGSYGMWDLTGIFTLERPSPAIVSVTFNVYSYSGGAHGNLVITCRNYDLASGRRLDFADLFGDPEKALELMSAWSRESLTKSLGDESDEDMIREGTAPDLRNFGELSLMPGGIGIQFQPYQVGPWSAGPQQVDMPLAALGPAAPEAAIWPDAGKTPANGDADGTPSPSSTPSATGDASGQRP